MNLRALLASSLLASLLAAVPAPTSDCFTNPSLTVTPDVLNVGDQATISYSNPSLAGQLVTIRIDNGSRSNRIETTITIQLDADGKGVATWTVPDWEFANFNATGVGEVNCPIEA